MKIIQIKTFDNIKIKVVKLEDVKEKVLEFEKEIYDWKLNSSESLNTYKRNKLIDCILSYHKKIFGDFKNETNENYTNKIKKENNLFVKDFKNLDSIMKNVSTIHKKTEEHCNYQIIVRELFTRIEEKFGDICNESCGVSNCTCWEEFKEKLLKEK